MHVFRRRVCLHEARGGDPGLRRVRVPPRRARGSAAFRPGALFAESGGTCGRRGLTCACPPPAPRARPPRPAPARLIGCRAEGRRRGGRGGLISDAASLLRPVVRARLRRERWWWRRRRCERLRRRRGGSGHPAVRGYGGACRLWVPGQRRRRAPCPAAVGSPAEQTTHGSPPGPARLGPWPAEPSPGVGEALSSRAGEEHGESGRRRRRRRRGAPLAPLAGALPLGGGSCGCPR